jgi:hypothetical protein
VNVLPVADEVEHEAEEEHLQGQLLQGHRQQSTIWGRCYKMSFGRNKGGKLENAAIYKPFISIHFLENWQFSPKICQNRQK